MKPKTDKNSLDALYRKFNHRKFVHPDPLEFLYHYDDPADREIAAIFSGQLAYGRVAQILKNLDELFKPMGKSPARFIAGSTPSKLKRIYSGFKHRWTTGEDIAALCTGIKKATKRYGSLERCFNHHSRDDDENVVPALDGFVAELRREGGSLLAIPCKGSACKRLHLFLRWLVRKDNVDPGGWDKVPRSKLIVPLDTHMHKIGKGLGLTSRKAADGKTAIEITRAFAEFSPEDPVKYDFALTRFGIRDELDIDALLS